MAEPGKIQMDRIMQAAIKGGASDIHLVVGKRPTLRLHGVLTELQTEVLSADATASCMKQITPEKKQIELQESGGTDFAFAFGMGSNSARFRVSVTMEEGGTTLVLRKLDNLFLTPQQIGLPPQLVELMQRERGLILVTGPTGSGKSTTLASLINHVTTTMKRSIITLEDPIEYRYQHGQCVVRQREVGTHVESFASGLRQALRMDPDIILVGEMRDLPTTRAALSAAETGHLVCATLHTSSASSTINRLIEQFDKNEQAQIRQQVSTGLLAVLCQTLVPLTSGTGRVAAFEFMVNVSGLGNLIRTEKVEQIPGMIQTNGKEGMQLLDDHLVQLVRRGLISAQDAYDKGNDKKRLRSELKL